MMECHSAVKLDRLLIELTTQMTSNIKEVRFQELHTVLLHLDDILQNVSHGKEN